MNKLLLIDKPANMTSHDVVALVKRKTHCKVGHCGTLDPNATGLLVLLLGSATKLLPYLDLDVKSYQAVATLSSLTDTLDIWGTVIKKAPIKPFTKTQFQQVCQQFIGKQIQNIPLVSAKKVAGKKLYEYHRQNIQVEQQTHQIEIFDIVPLACTKDSFSFSTTVSKGTYIRQLCVDIADRLDNLAAMSSLVRTKVGCFDLKEAIQISDLDQWQNHLVDVDQALSHYPVLHVEQPESVRQGKNIAHQYLGDLVLVCYQNEKLAFYRYLGNEVYQCERGIWS